MGWNYNMDEAPRGEWRDVKTTLRGKEYIRLEHFPELIIAAGSDGVVTLSKWVAHQERWNMFSKDAPPIAWMPWPKHPEAN